MYYGLQYSKYIAPMGGNNIDTLDTLGNRNHGMRRFTLINNMHRMSDRCYIDRRIVSDQCGHLRIIRNTPRGMMSWSRPVFGMFSKSMHSGRRRRR